MNNEVRAPAELVADLLSWLRAHTGVVDTPVPGTVAELMGRLVMRWHEGEVAIVTGERDGARQARDMALEDNQRLHEEIGAMRKANADHQKQVGELRQERDITLEDNRRLLEEMDRWQHWRLDYYTARDERDRALAEVERLRREAVADATAKGVDWDAVDEETVEIRMPICSRCGRALKAGEPVGYRVLADGTIGMEHQVSCPAPGDAL